MLTPVSACFFILFFIGIASNLVEAQISSSILISISSVSSQGNCLRLFGEQLLGVVQGHILAQGGIVQPFLTVQHINMMVFDRFEA